MNLVVLKNPYPLPTLDLPSASLHSSFVVVQIVLQLQMFIVVAATQGFISFMMVSIFETSLPDVSGARSPSKKFVTESRYRL